MIVTLKAAVAEAIDQIKATYPETVVSWQEDGEGGAWVKVHDFEIGTRFNLLTTWIGFHVTYTYPHAQVYPHFGVPGLTLANGTALDPTAGFQQTQWGPEGKTEAVTQFSRSSNHWDPEVDTAAIKLEKVIQWLRN